MTRVRLVRIGLEAYGAGVCTILTWVLGLESIFVMFALAGALCLINMVIIESSVVWKQLPFRGH